MKIIYNGLEIEIPDPKPTGRMSVKPFHVARLHQRLCQSAGCTLQLDYTDPCTGCPLGHYPRYRICLGDAIAAVAQPIAKGIDSVFHTNLTNCGGCKQRQQTLNKIQL